MSRLALILAALLGLSVPARAAEPSPSTASAGHGAARGMVSSSSPLTSRMRSRKPIGLLGHMPSQVSGLPQQSSRHQ